MMKDRRPVADLSIEELEEILRTRKRAARLERMRQRGKNDPSLGLDPLAPEVVPPETADLPADQRRFANRGATAAFRSREVDEDGSPVKEVSEQRSRRAIRWDWVRDKSLLIVEIGVLIALVVVLISTLLTLREINAESEQSLQVPTPTTAPVIDVVLLPGGHTPPDNPGGPAPEEIPAHLQDLVGQITPLPVPTPGPEHATFIEIAAINVQAPVVEGDDWESLRQGAGHHIGSANPGERGNCVISAHNDIFGEIFRDLPQMDVGDEVLVHTTTQVYRYEVTQSRIIEPSEVSVMYPTSGAVLTLISCYPYGIDTHRIVVTAELQP